jgi:hypothetical protein
MMQKNAMRPPPVIEQLEGATLGHHDAVAVPIAEVNAFPRRVPARTFLVYTCQTPLRFL